MPRDSLSRLTKSASSEFLFPEEQRVQCVRVCGVLAVERRTQRRPVFVTNVRLVAAELSAELPRRRSRALCVRPRSAECKK